MKPILWRQLLICGSLFLAGAAGAVGQAPDGLMIEFLQGSTVFGITDATPEFGWIVRSAESSDRQTAYRILVASRPEVLAKDRGDLWDSGRVERGESINVEYKGRRLCAKQSCFWKVKAWTAKGGESEWSEVQSFLTAQTLGIYSTPGYAVVKDAVAPAELVRNDEGHYFVDFGRAAAGTVRLTLDAPSDDHVVTCRLGEKLAAPNLIDAKPGGSIRYLEIKLPLKKGRHDYILEVPPHEYNNGKRTLKMPAEVGEVLPFRYCELSGVPGTLEQDDVRQIAVHYPFDEDAASFSSSNKMLNRVWELCRYSIKATSYCGLYIDGDRERFPREADSYINQISHYCLDREYTLGRRTHEFMMTHTSQWTEWMLHSVIMAWTDYQYTGNKESLRIHYDDLKHKTLMALAREDGLISTKTGLVDDELRKLVHYYQGEHVKGKEFRDIVDWPKSERDGYRFGEINTVVNAFHYRALVLMADIARTLEKDDDAELFASQADLVKESVNCRLFNARKGIYMDGEGDSHSSLHANMFPLALGLVSDANKKTVVNFIKSRGMACSVYGAQYLLEGLYAVGEDGYALELMTSTGKRSWYNMLRVGSTITMEAWDLEYKKNLDWNHAWGTAPANIIPRYVLGVRPLEPGFGMALIQPQPGSLVWASGTVPTIRGPVSVSFRNDPAHPFELSVDIPVNISAKVALPFRGDPSAGVTVNGETVKTEFRDGCLFVEKELGSGHHVVRGQ